MAAVKNPVLTGFHPDPSMICVGDDYYIATSTFEWFPGVALYHSRDLAHWELLPAPLNRLSQLNMTGEQCSTGVWAPELSYCDGRFYLIYSDVKTGNGGMTFYDVRNYLVTADDICGEWSEPVYINSSGFDPSLFHDDDGRSWFVNMQFDYRPWNIRFGGIVIQEYSKEEQKLIGEPKNIFVGTTRRVTEAPHIYKKDGYYYLFCAEGGTKYDHCETVVRSKNILGPYELSPFSPLITSKPYPLNPLQKAGHASIAKGADGKWYLAHLCGRPVGKERCCILGRETAIQELVWEDGWPRLSGGVNEPAEFFEAPCKSMAAPGAPSASSESAALPEYAALSETVPPKFSPSWAKTGIWAGQDWRDDFDKENWNPRFLSLRIPLSKRASLRERTGWLRLYGRESLESLYEQSFLAARQQHFYFQADTKLECSPVSYQQTAGLVYYYDTLSWYYLCVTADEQKGRVLTVMHKILNQFSMPLGVGVSIPDEGTVYLRLEAKKETAQFYYSLDGVQYEAIGDTLDATVLSDDYYRKISTSRFTGAFVGICCQDIAGRGGYADFDYFEYRARNRDESERIENGR